MEHKDNNLFLFPTRTHQGFVDDPLQLPVGAAEFIGGPSFQRLECFGIDAQDETFGAFLGHTLISYKAFRR